MKLFCRSLIFLSVLISNGVFINAQKCKNAYEKGFTSGSKLKKAYELLLKGPNMTDSEYRRAWDLENQAASELETFGQHIEKYITIAERRNNRSSLKSHIKSGADYINGYKKALQPLTHKNTGHLKAEIDTVFYTLDWLEKMLKIALTSPL